MATYRIYPAIGIARVGNSDEEYYIAAESPQINFVPPGGYRDAEDKIKRMGCRFRIYEFDQHGVPVREITADDANIEWSVNLVNKKAAKTGLNQVPAAADLTIDSWDSGVVEVVGINQNLELGGTIGPSTNTIDVKLGNLITDYKGRLIVLGGHGESEKWDPSALDPDNIDNPGWYDDTSDGPVHAHLTFPNGDEIDAESAWVLVGPPDFAHPIVNFVTLYDIVWDRTMPASLEAPSFTRDIFPLLHRTVFMHWTNFHTVGKTAMHGHTGNIVEHPLANFLEPTNFQLLHDKTDPEGQRLRLFVFDQLRNPNGGGFDTPSVPGALDGDMPPLLAATTNPPTFLTLTFTQYENFRRWSIDDFIDDWPAAWNPVEPPQPTFENIPLRHRPTTLTEAALGGGVGGSFFPGIEGDSNMGDPLTYRAPFRIDSNARAAGDLTEGLSVPWQADFNLCTEVWWPGARPVLVLVKGNGTYTTEDWTRDIPPGPSSNLGMVNNWSELGFIAKDPSGVALPTSPTQGAPSVVWSRWGESVGHPDLLYIETERTLI